MLEATHGRLSARGAAVCLGAFVHRSMVMAKLDTHAVAVREGGGAMALMPWCYAAGNGLVRLVVWLPVGMGTPSDTAALADRGMTNQRRPAPLLQRL